MAMTDSVGEVAVAHLHSHGVSFSSGMYLVSLLATCCR
jgi:hypothetical protein